MSEYKPNPAAQAKFYAAVTKAANAGLLRAAVECKGFAQKSMAVGGRGIASAPGRPPNQQRGGLAKSVYAFQRTDFRAHCGSNLAYAKIQERGGTIRAKRSKYLPVPLNLPAQRLLERHGATAEYIEGGGGLGYIGRGGLRSSGVPLHVIPRKGKPPLLVGSQGPRAAVAMRRGHGAADKEGKTLGSMSGVPVFVLVKQIRLAPRPWLIPALENNKVAIRTAAFHRAAEVLTQEGFGGTAITGSIR